MLLCYLYGEIKTFVYNFLADEELRTGLKC